MALPNHIVCLIDDVAKKEQFIECAVDFNAGSKHGDNFSAELLAIKIRGSKNQNGKIVTETKHLICKTAPTNPHRRHIYRTTTAFERETEFYNDILPTFVQFQQQRGLTGENRFSSYIDVHATICDHVNERFVLIMDDLRAKNYEMYPKDRCTTYDHAKLIMIELAKFHAISFALKDQNPELFECYKRKDIVIEMLRNGVSDGTCSMLNQYISNLDDEHHKRLIEELKTDTIPWLEKFMSDDYIGDSGVILHGDCWNNNFLFQYENNVSS